MNIRVESTTTGYKVREIKTTKTGRETSRVIGRAKTYDEVDTIISRHEASASQALRLTQV